MARPREGLGPGGERGDAGRSGGRCGTRSGRARRPDDRGDRRPSGDGVRRRSAVGAAGVSALDPRQTGEMPFLAHLDELRRVLLHTVVAGLIGAVAGWMLAPRVLEMLIRRTVGHAVVLAPMEAFNERFRMSMVIGLVIDRKSVV